MASRILRRHLAYISNHPDGLTLAKMAAVAVVSLAVANATTCVITHEEYFDGLQRRFLLYAAYFVSSSFAHLPAILCLLAVLYADRLQGKSTACLDPSPSPVPIFTDRKGSEGASRLPKCSGGEDHVLEDNMPTGREPASPSRDSPPREENTLTEKFSGSGCPRRDEAARSDDVLKGCPDRHKSQYVPEARPPRCPVPPSSTPRPVSGTGLDGLTPSGRWPGRSLSQSPPGSPQFRRRRYDARFVDIGQVGPANRGPTASSRTGNHEASVTQVAAVSPDEANSVNKNVLSGSLESHFDQVGGDLRGAIPAGVVEAGRPE